MPRIRRRSEATELSNGQATSPGRTISDKRKLGARFVTFLFGDLLTCTAEVSSSSPTVCRDILLPIFYWDTRRMPCVSREIHRETFPARPQACSSSTRGSPCTCLLYTSDAADERSSVDLGGRRIIK